MTRTLSRSETLFMKGLNCISAHRSLASRLSASYVTCTSSQRTVISKNARPSVKRKRYVLPTLEDVTSKLSGASVFSSLDATNGFYQIPLEEGSCELTTFITPFGRYCFRRLPFGITSAPEIFMKKMKEVLDGLEGTVA